MGTGCETMQSEAVGTEMVARSGHDATTMAMLTENEIKSTLMTAETTTTMTTTATTSTLSPLTHCVESPLEATMSNGSEDSHVGNVIAVDESSGETRDGHDLPADELKQARNCPVLPVFHINK